MSIALVFLLASLASPLLNYDDEIGILPDAIIINNSPSNTSIAFGNGPNTDDYITGLHTLTSTLSGTGNISSI